MQGASFLGSLEVLWEPIEKTRLPRDTRRDWRMFLHFPAVVLECGSLTATQNGEKHYTQTSYPVRSIRGGPSSRGTSQARSEAQAGGATVRSPGNAAGASRPASNARGITREAVANGYLCRLRPWPQCCGEQTQGRAERFGRKANICRDLASARLPFHQRSGLAGFAGPEARSLRNAGFPRVNSCNCRVPIPDSFTAPLPPRSCDYPCPRRAGGSCLWLRPRRASP